MIQPRKLAAIDIAFLGPGLIFAEFGFGVLFPLAMGAFVLLRARAPVQVLLGLHFLALGANYVPLLLHAISLRTRERARAELGSELNDKGRAMAKYRRQSLYLLLPLVTPIAALADRRGEPASEP
jgi:hypothetical protein